MSGDPGLATGESQQVSVGADAVGRAGPDGVEDIVKELAALLDGEACLSGFPALRCQARGGEGFEGALGLGGEDGCAAGDRTGRERDAAEVFDRDGERVPAWREGQVHREGLRCGGQLCDETRGAGLGSGDLAGVAEVDFGSGGEEAGGDGVGQIPIELGGGVGHAGFALDFRREQRVGCAGGRPGVFSCAEEPDGVGSEAGGLGGAGDLDGGVAGFGSKEGFIEGASEGGEKLVPADAAAVVAEGACGFKGLLPTAGGLVLGAGERGGGGETEGLEELGNEFGPVERGLRAAGLLGETTLGLGDPVGPGDGQGSFVRPAGERSEEGVEGPGGTFEAATAQRAHAGLQGGGLGGAGGGVGGGEEPVEFVLGERGGEPTQKQVGGARERDLAERDAERELEERGAGGAGVLKKGALDLAAAGGCILGDDEDAGAGVAGKLLGAGEGAGGEFGLVVGGFIEVDLGGGVAMRSFAPGAPGVEDGALDGENAVKSGEE